MFIEMCEKDGVPITKQASGKFVVRLPNDLHALATLAARTTGISLNKLVERAIEHELSA